MFSQTLLLFLLQSVVVHKVSRSTSHNNIYAFYFDNEHLYRFSPCRTLMGVGHIGTFGAPLNVRHFFSKFDSEYFSLIMFFKYIFILLLIMISCIIMTFLGKNKICRTFRDPTYVYLHVKFRVPYSTFLAPCALNYFRVAANF